MAVTHVATNAVAAFGDPSIAVDVPASAQPGDRFIVVVSSRFWSTVDVDFTPEDSVGPWWSTENDGNSLKAALYTGIIGTHANAGQTINVGNNNSGGQNQSVAVAVFRGASTPAVTPLVQADMVATDDTGTDSAPQAPDVTLPEDGLLVFGCGLYTTDNTPNITPPTGYTEIADEARTGAHVHLSYDEVTSGSSGTATASADDSGQWWAMHALIYEEVTDATDPTVGIDEIHGAGHAESVHDASGYDGDNDELTVTGTAADTGGSGLDTVEVRVNGGAWQAATGTTSWSIALDVSGWAPGQHTIEARATDGAGNTSTLASETVWHSPDGLWGASASGTGHLEPLSTEGWTP